LLAHGDLRVHVGQRFPFERIREAFEARAAGHAVGKIVVEF
jgi:NADPH:quinone reductase-like Zn-dependent oxidoreductase